jgi:hypothetical protein
MLHVFLVLIALASFVFPFKTPDPDLYKIKPPAICVNEDCSIIVTCEDFPLDTCSLSPGEECSDTDLKNWYFEKTA